jgi:hypothetical protein
VLCLVELTAQTFLIQYSEKFGNKFAVGCQFIFRQDLAAFSMKVPRAKPAIAKAYSCAEEAEERSARQWDESDRKRINKFILVFPAKFKSPITDNE